MHYKTVTAVTGFCASRVEHEPMAYKVQRELEDGELVEVTTRADLEKAEVLVRALKEHWPGVYRITEIVDETGAIFHRSLH